MKVVNELPQDYKEIFSMDLNKDKKLSFFVNFFSILLAVAVFIIGCFIVPFNTFYNLKDILGTLVKMLLVLFLIVVYIVLHELVHGVAMKICGTKKIKYGFTGLYAFAGSDDYYDKKSYIFIALAPVVLWGVVLALINIFVPTGWFWVVYLIQMMNISGAAGDLYITFKSIKFPKDSLVKDYGVSMKVFSKENL